jgi:serine protease Do
MIIVRKRVLPVSISVILITAFSLVSCKFSFAEFKHPDKGSVNFGAEKKPDVKQDAQLQSFKTVFADVAEKVIPSVVSITSTKIDTVIYQNPFDQFFGGSPFDDFFGNPQQPQDQHGRRNAPQQGQRQIIPRSGVGSGVIVSKDGYILTNRHVVGDADAITVETSDDRKYEAEIVGTDSLADVAVIKIKDKVDNLPVAYLGNSEKMRPGDWVMAIGNPFNLSSTVTVGIVSALGRRTGGGIAYQNFIQTDAAINPGNSGGALVNIDGELIGINTMIYTQSGGYMGIGFAIPINMAKRIMEDLIYTGKVSRGWLGISIQELTPATRDAMGLGEQKGVLIGDVFKGQPADKGGIKRGDVVTAINGKPVSSQNELMLEVANVAPGTTIPVKLIRNKKEMTAQVKVTARDEASVNKMAAGSTEPAEGAGVTAEKLGIKVGPITPDVKQQLGLSSDVTGVVVEEVAQGSQAAQETIQQGDIIREINQAPVTSVKDFKEAMKSVKPGNPVLFLIQREGNTFYIAFKVRK